MRRMPSARMGAEMRIALSAIAVGIAALAAGASRLDATAGTEECSSLSAVSMYSLGWPEIRGNTNRGQLWVTGGLGPSAIPGPAGLRRGGCLPLARPVDLREVGA